MINLPVGEEKKSSVGGGIVAIFAMVATYIGLGMQQKADYEKRKSRAEELENKMMTARHSKDWSAYKEAASEQSSAVDQEIRMKGIRGLINSTVLEAIDWYERNPGKQSRVDFRQQIRECTDMFIEEYSKSNADDMAYAKAEIPLIIQNIDKLVEKNEGIGR